MNTSVVRTKKRCSRCEEWKPFDQFYPKKRGQINTPFNMSSMDKLCYKAVYTYEYRKLIVK